MLERGQRECVCVFDCVCVFVRCSVVNVICSGRESMSNVVRVRRVTKQDRVTLCPLSNPLQVFLLPPVACWVSVIRDGSRHTGI